MRKAMIIWMLDPVDAPLYEAVVKQLGDRPEVRLEPPRVRVLAPHLPRSYGRVIWKLLKEDGYVPLQFDRDLVEREVARDVGRAPADPIANWRAFKPEPGRGQRWNGARPLARSGRRPIPASRKGGRGCSAP